MSNAVELIPVANAAQVAEVARLAHQVWNEFYVPIIGQAQVDYMVAKFQSAEAMQSQIDSGYEYFRIRQSGENIGYAAIRHDAPDGRVFISKLYLLATHRKTGAGRQALEHIERIARERGATHLWLTVNKGNPSVRAYERLGFGIVEALVMDIGGGYVMDDYKMEKAVASR
ncbi:MAG TPA: GNAT family N-acetyltransferase [Steroidobacteraceae bacterium]|jgi:ribosomal protein S18 acetylase RimI-like enzyme|nr:GNAT family N-acetyltransferase [Steroidobacteraceae bacterium]